DGGADFSHARRNRPPGQGDRHRRFGGAVRRGERHLRYGRRRSDTRRTGHPRREGRRKVTSSNKARPGKELLFCALGGSGEIGMNVNLYGCDGKWLMVDLGMTFSGNEYPGVDLVFADLEFIE